MEILDEKWLERLLMYTMQEDIAVTGSRLMDKYELLWEAGYIIRIGTDFPLNAYPLSDSWLSIFTFAFLIFKTLEDN